MLVGLFQMKKVHEKLDEKYEMAYHLKQNIFFKKKHFFILFEMYAEFVGEDRWETCLLDEKYEIHCVSHLKSETKRQKEF